MASAAGYMTAAPSPWTTRNVTIHASAPPLAGVSPHIVEATAKTTTPTTTIFPWPTVSTRRPPKAKKAASASR